MGGMLVLGHAMACVAHAGLAALHLTATPKGDRDAEARERAWWPWWPPAGFDTPLAAGPKKSVGGKPGPLGTFEYEETR